MPAGAAILKETLGDRYIYSGLGHYCVIGTEGHGESGDRTTTQQNGD